MSISNQAEESDIHGLISTTDLEEADYVRVKEPMFPGLVTGLLPGKMYKVERDDVRNYLFPSGESYVTDENGRANYSFSTVHDHELYKTK